MPKTKTNNTDEKLFKGYFNYRILNDTTNALKTYYFHQLPMSRITALKTQFRNPQLYHYFGSKIVEIPKEEASV